MSIRDEVYLKTKGVQEVRRWSPSPAETHGVFLFCGNYYHVVREGWGAQGNYRTQCYAEDKGGTRGDDILYESFNYDLPMERVVVQSALGLSDAVVDSGIEFISTCDASPYEIFNTGTIGSKK